MAVIHGNAGLGKTYAVDELVDELDVEVMWTSFPSQPTPRLVAATLFEQLCGRPTRLDRFSIIAQLVTQLASGPRLVVIDESQLLTGDCIELLRYLHDHQATRFAPRADRRQRNVGGAFTRADARQPSVPPGPLQRPVSPGCDRRDACLPPYV